MTERTVVHVVYPGIIMLDLAGPAEVFAAANRFAESGPRYRSVVASVDGRPLVTNSGLQLGVDTRLSSVTGRRRRHGDGRAATARLRPEPRRRGRMDRPTDADAVRHGCGAAGRVRADRASFARPRSSPPGS